MRFLRGIAAVFVREASSPAALDRFIAGRPVPGLVDRGRGAAHVNQLPRWITIWIPQRSCATAPGQFLSFWARAVSAR